MKSNTKVSMINSSKHSRGNSKFNFAKELENENEQEYIESEEEDPNRPFK